MDQVKRTRRCIKDKKQDSQAEQFHVSMVQSYKSWIIAILAICIGHYLSHYTNSILDDTPNTNQDCHNLHKDAKNAIARAKTSQCKKDLSEVACKNLYPSHIQSQCDYNVQDTDLVYFGCFQDSFDSRIFPNLKVKFEENSPRKCIRYCAESGFQFSGLQYSYECFCSHDFFPQDYLKLDEAKCDKTCAGDANSKCGGYLTMNIYQSNLQLLNQNPEKPEIRVVYLFVVHGRSLRQIKRHFKWLYNPQDYFFFHVDSRSSYLYQSIKELESQAKNIRVTDNRFATIWGGASLLKMLISCFAEMSTLNWDYDYVINLSESDYLLKNPEEFKRFLTDNQGKNFVKSHGGNIATFVRKQGLDKTFYECDNHMFRLGPRTLPKGLKFDGGSDWICLNKNFIDYLLKNSESDELLNGLFKLFNYTLLPAESFFHTTLRNSPFCVTYVNNNLRITNWKRHLGCQCQHKNVVDWCGCSPNVFKMADWKKISNSKSRQVFFARKFDASLNQAVINALDQWIFDVELTENFDYYWENIFHFKDDDQNQEVLSLAKLLLNEEILEVNALFIQDTLDSLLFLSRQNSEFRYKIKTNSVLTENGDLIQIGAKFDVKEQVFRSLIQVLGSGQIPQLLMKTLKNEKIESKEASVLWIFDGKLAASNRSFNINTTLGYHILNFPPFLPRSNGIWSAIYIDNTKLMTQIDFLVINNTPKMPLKQNEGGNPEEIQFIQNMKFPKEPKVWIQSIYQLINQCKNEEDCRSTDWSSRSPDPKSTLNFEL